MIAPFVIFALPRSRTYWLSRFLSYGDWTCGHDEARHFRSLEDIRSWLSQDCTGTVETAVAPWWRLLAKYRPDARVVIVRRPVEEVVNSLMALDMRGTVAFDRTVLTRTMKRLDAKLDQVAARWPNALSVQYADLVDGATCARIFCHCLPYPFDVAWWSTFANVNLQCSMTEMMRYYKAYQPQLTKIGAIAKQTILTDLAARPCVPLDGMVIETEPLETFLRDGVDLFAEHSVEVGEEPDSYLRKNIPQHRLLEENGRLQIVTARANGRMFGYLMTVIGPSLETPDTLWSVQTTFFASKDAPGLGLKLQRASLVRLKAKGVDEVFFRAGPRGSGPKMGVLYRRLGAVPDGETYRLNLGVV